MSRHLLNLGRAESIEAEVWYQIAVGAPAATATALGIEAARIGGGVVTTMREDASSFWNRAMGFGITEPVTADLIGDVIDFYRTTGRADGTIQIAPPFLPPDWDEIALKHRLVARGGIAKQVGRIDALCLGASRLRIGRVPAHQAHEWAEVMLGVYGMPTAGLREMTAALVSNPTFTTFAAWDRDRIVSTASMLVNGATAHLHSGATLPGYRRRGAQTGLIAARVGAAAEAGCDWVVTETSATGSSAENMRRSGFWTPYVRQSWSWAR